MNEAEIQSFWQTHPCGENLVGELEENYENFFKKYDLFRYKLEKHILRCLDQIDFKNKETLEIGLGQGADSEQIIRRGAHWSGLDLTAESISRVKTRLNIRQLPFRTIQQGSALHIPWPENSFDIVYSHGVLHHIPEIENAQKEIYRVLKPGGKLVIMLYSKWSLNYLVSIFILRRLALLAFYLLKIPTRGILNQHLENVKEYGLFNYLKMSNFIHRNTDGPLNPYSKVYDLALVKKDFPLFSIIKSHKEFLHAPPLPVSNLPGSRWLGWHLWVHLTPQK